MSKIITAVALATSIATAGNFIELDQKLTEHRLQDVANASIECFGKHPELVKEAEDFLAVSDALGKSDVAVDEFEKAIATGSKFRQSLKSTCKAYNDGIIAQWVKKTEHDVVTAYMLLDFIASCKDIPTLIKELKDE